MRVRRSARLVVIDERQRVLLFRYQDQVAFDTQRPNVPYWATVGGGVEEGESFEETALRELREETGIAGVPIGPWLWTREKVLVFPDETMLSHERYFLVRAGRQMVSLAGLLPYERAVYRGHRWWAVDELRTCTESVFPLRMAELLGEVLAGRIPEEPLWLEE